MFYELWYCSASNAQFLISTIHHAFPPNLVQRVFWLLSSMLIIASLAAIVV